MERYKSDRSPQLHLSGENKNANGFVNKNTDSKNEQNHPRYDVAQIFSGRFKVALPAIVREGPHFSYGNPRNHNIKKFQRILRAIL